jgi:CheY-like chemotaxis protein
MTSEKYILLVEDNMVAAKVAQKILKQLGCIVDCTEDGNIAIELALANNYHAICLDIGLITISGVDVCRAIRAYESENKLDPIPIIALTANNSPLEIAEYLDVGMQDVLSKPLTREKAEKFLSFCKN